MRVHVQRRGLCLAFKSDRIRFTMNCINEDVARNAAALLVDFIDGVVKRAQLSLPQDVDNAVLWAWRLLAEQRERKTGAIFHWMNNPGKYCDQFTNDQLGRLQFLKECDGAALQEQLYRLLNPPQSPSEHSSDHDERKSNEDSSGGVTRRQRPWEGAHDVGA